MPPLSFKNIKVESSCDNSATAMWVISRTTDVIIIVITRNLIAKVKMGKKFRYF